MIADNVINTFCRMRGVDRETLESRSHESSVWETRYMVWHYLHYYKDMSAGLLSKIFHRNKPSIFRGIRLIKHQMRYYAELREEYYRIVEILEGETENPPSNDI